MRVLSDVPYVVLPITLQVRYHIIIISILQINGGTEEFRNTHEVTQQRSSGDQVCPQMVPNQSPLCYLLLFVASQVSSPSTSSPL